MSVWWDEQTQSRVDTRTALEERLKCCNEELDSWFADLKSSYTARINVLVLEATKKHEADTAAKKLRLLEEERQSDAARSEKVKQELEDAKKLKEAEEVLATEAKRNNHDLRTKLTEINKEIEKLKLSNEKKAKENKEAAAELENAVKQRDQEQKRADAAKIVPSWTKPASSKNVSVKSVAPGESAFGGFPSAQKPAAQTENSTSTAEATTPAMAGTSSAGPESTTANAATAENAGSPPKSAPLGSSGSAEAEFNANAERIQWIKHNVRAVAAKQPKEVKQFLTDAKLDLRPKFGMLTNSKKQLISCRDAVKALFQKAKDNQNAIVYQYLLNLYAKLLIEQSESEANVQLQNALPLAMLTVLLWADFPELGEYVIPRFIKKCPQVIGYFCPITTEVGRKRMGWKRDDDTGKYETEEQYMGRISGICAVWACMTQSKLAAKDTRHPYNMGHSWKFMARMLNKPRDSVTQVDHCLVAAWWDMTALRFSEAFGKQGIKVLELAWNQWTEGFSDPPSMRLRGLGENWKTTGKIDHAWKPLI